MIKEFKEKIIEMEDNQNEYEKSKFLLNAQARTYLPKFWSLKVIIFNYQNTFFIFWYQLTLITQDLIYLLYMVL